MKKKQKERTILERIFKIEKREEEILIICADHKTPMQVNHEKQQYECLYCNKKATYEELQRYEGNNEVEAIWVI